MSAGHHPTPMEEAQDQYGSWHLFSDLFGVEASIPLLDLHPYGIPFALTRFMVVQLLAALIVGGSFIWLANRIRNGEIARGTRANLLESLLLFVRNDIVRPVLGGPAGDFMLPYVWTVFFYILTCNLLGMLPLVGSPMASLWITMSLALCSLVLMIAVPVAKIGFVNYLKTMWIPVDIPVAGVLVSLLLFVIEFLGQFIKGAVLGLRLFCNILVGHVVLATIMTFAGAVAFLPAESIPATESGMVSFFTFKGFAALFGSIIGGVLLSLLELLVAFLQAYVFALLTTLFIALPLQHHADHEAAHGHGHDHEHGHEHHGEKQHAAAH